MEGMGRLTKEATLKSREVVAEVAFVTQLASAPLVLVAALARAVRVATARSLLLESLAAALNDALLPPVRLFHPWASDPP